MPFWLRWAAVQLPSTTPCRASRMPSAGLCKVLTCDRILSPTPLFGTRISTKETRPPAARLPSRVSMQRPHPHTRLFHSIPTTIPVHISSTTPPLPPLHISRKNARARPGGSLRVAMAHLPRPAINRTESRGVQLLSSTRLRSRRPGMAASASNAVTNCPRLKSSLLRSGLRPRPKVWQFP